MDKDRQEQLLKEFSLYNAKLSQRDDIKNSYGYLKGFYDATHQLMQTFEKIVELGVLNGTKANTDN